MDKACEKTLDYFLQVTAKLAQQALSSVTPAEVTEGGKAETPVMKMRFPGKSEIIVV